LVFLVPSPVTLLPFFRPPDNRSTIVFRDVCSGKLFDK
jgi:hypothetical protein